MAEVDTPSVGGTFAGSTTDRGRTPGGRFNGDGISGFVAQVLEDSILWIGTNPPSADQYVLWINTEDGRWYGKWNDGDSTQWVDLSLPFGEGLPGPQGIQGERGVTGSTGQGIPTGGTTDQILLKLDGTDYNTYWGTRPADGYSVLNGTVDPVDVSDGVDGDFFINTTSWDIFGPKASGAWPVGVSLIGPTGATGADGADGAAGAAGADGASGADGEGVPVGGTADQLLAKIDGTDYNTEWVDAPTSLPIGGTDGQVLTKQSATDGDADWETPAISGGSTPATFKGFRAHLLSNQALPATTGVDIVWDDVQVDTVGGFNTTTGIWTTPSALDGKYMMFNAFVRLDSVENSQIYIYINGANVGQNTNDSDPGSGTIIGPILVNTGDEVKIRYYSGSTTNATANARCYFGGFVIESSDNSIERIVDVSGLRVISDEDLNGRRIIYMDNASAQTLTVNTGLTGTEPITIITRGGGQLTVGGTATINSKGSATKSNGDNSSFTLIPEGSDTYTMIGDITS